MTHPEHASSDANSAFLHQGIKIELGSWRVQPPQFLDELLLRINSARQEPSETRRLDGLIRSLRFMWQALKDGRGVGNDETISLMSVDNTAINVIEDYLEYHFERPSCRLAVYGSLRPGESNFGQMAGIEGVWLDGTVPGIVEQPTEYLEFTWIASAPPVAVDVMSSARLDQHLGRLDEFEGPDYVRTWVPVTIDGVIQVCNIYEGKRNHKDRR